MLTSRKERPRPSEDAAPSGWRRPAEALVEPPIRSQLFSVSQLEQHARALASGHEVSPSAHNGPDRLLPRLAANEVALREAYALVTQAVKKGAQITPAAEWFVDNYHLLEEQIRTARRHLPRGYSRELPRLGNALVAGTPRVYDLTLEFISHTHGRLDMDGLRAFIASYQEQRLLTLGELWALPIMLRLALIENVRRIVAGVTAGRRDRELAGHWVEQMLEVAGRDPSRVVLVLAEMVRADPPLSLALVAELATRLSGAGAAPPGRARPVGGGCVPPRQPGPGSKPGRDRQQLRQPQAARRDGLATVRGGAQQRRAHPA
jgi:cyclic beta-1,2-glucan synthetase